MGFSALLKRLASSKKRLVLFSIFFFLFSFFSLAGVNKINAQSPIEESSSQTQYLTPNTNPDVPRNLNTWTQNVMIEVMQSMVCQLGGTLASQNSDMQCLGIDPQTGKIGFVKNGQGAIGVMGNLIAVLYTPPAHFSDYTRYLAQNFGIAKPALAQNQGLQSISPLGKAWTVFRNFVYIFFVIVFIVIGVAIMLRVRIDPRTVMSIQNQIPKLIVGLVLVTFSFAIAGLLIDLMWLSIYLVINTFGIADSNINPGPITAELNRMPLDFAGNGSVLGTLHEHVFNVSYGVGQAVFDLITGANVAQGGTDPLNFLDIVGNVISAVIGAIVGFIAITLILLILFIAILWALFKLWFELLKAYINILISILFAPFWIVAGLLPGASPKVGFGAWLREMLANLSAFPAVIAMFLLGKLFIDIFNNPSTDWSKLFVAPLLGNPEANSSQMIGSLVALGIILATPGVVKMTKEAFKATGISFGPIGQAVGVGRGVVAAPIRGVGRELFGRNPKTGEWRPGAQAAFDYVGRRRFVPGFIKNRLPPPPRATTQTVPPPPQPAGGNAGGGTAGGTTP